MAPAGAGKTFVGVCFLLELMSNDQEAVCLFVARNVALCHFVVRWMSTRLPNAMKRLQILQRLRVLFDPLADGPRTVRVSGRRVLFELPGGRAGGRGDRFDLRCGR